MMARGRLEIKRIENPTQRQSTFYKRRDGLFKKARELAVLCDADLLLLLFSSSGKLYHYHSPSVSNVQELLRRYEVASRTRIPTDQGGEKVEEMEKMCEFLEREIRFMRIGEEEEYTFPVLEVIEQNLEAAIKKVREEKDRKIQAEMESLHRMVKDRGLEGYELCEKQSLAPTLHGDSSFGEQALFGYELDLKLGFD
ncbi:MADS-box transcription factor 32-like [Phalaenopsis equestris]|uniref:MADS-box transcription factor 32-like n=1 Tax=Phalaenopsis equestris TaxID=78828 RepID=UPI0009E5DD7A|nr:MADS-box transcription factor 32-like [Phalaenopsis equestris]